MPAKPRPPRGVDHDSPLTPELAERLLEALDSGLKPRHVALSCMVSPKTLRGWLEQGARPDGLNPYVKFSSDWVRREAALMRTHVENWRLGMPNSYQSQQFLERRWPSIWGKDCEPDFEPLKPTSSNAEEQQQLEDILADPASFGLFELFARFDRLTTAERKALPADADSPRKPTQ